MNYWHFLKQYSQIFWSIWRSTLALLWATVNALLTYPMILFYAAPLPPFCLLSASFQAQLQMCRYVSCHSSYTCREDTLRTHTHTLPLKNSNKNNNNSIRLCLYYYFIAFRFIMAQALTNWWLARCLRYPVTLKFLLINEFKWSPL